VSVDTSEILGIRKDYCAIGTLAFAYLKVFEVVLDTLSNHFYNTMGLARFNRAFFDRVETEGAVSPIEQFLSVGGDILARQLGRLSWQRGNYRRSPITGKWLYVR
jgi:hypothetical protein